ncbi:MAG: class I SAM-dependent methyltransferase [Gammaproteobacteria bacterium]|nr:class I SAM-dependent methyltransferase [Gammaproteobacteria bacterium]
MPTYAVSLRDGLAPSCRARLRQFQKLIAQLNAATLADGAAGVAIDVDTAIDTAAADFHIEFEPDGAMLSCAALPDYAPHHVCFNRGPATVGGDPFPAATGGDPLRRAIGGAATVVDATAGWGVDAARLASWGCRVTAVEKHPVVAALLQHAHAQCREDVRARLTVVHADSVAFLRDLAAADAPDVVYLDPMYPPNPKSAAAKKPLTMLRLLAGPLGDNRALFDAAIASARRRVVVKRPHRAPPLAPHKTGETTGKLARFDIYKPSAA